MQPLPTEKAEIVSLQALTWLAGHDELLPVFLGSSGASTGDLAAGARDPAFLASILDFILMDDAWVMAFTDANGLAPDMVIRARGGLPGGGDVHWT